MPKESYESIKASYLQDKLWKRNNQYCSAPTCTNNRRACPGTSFFRFPRDPARCKKWIKNSRRFELLTKDGSTLYRSHFLCAAHFEDSQFMNATFKNKLTWNALPTLFNVPNPPLSIAEEKARGSPFFPPSPKPAVPMDDTRGGTHGNPLYNYGGGKRARSSQPQGCQIRWHYVRREPVFAPAPPSKETLPIETQRLIKSQRAKIYRLKKQVDQLRLKPKMLIVDVDDVIRGSAKFLKGIPYKFFATQLRLASQKKHGKRWTTEDQMFALSLSYISAEAYELCSKVFCLPTGRTLQRWWKQSKRTPDFQERQLKPFIERLKALGDETNKEAGGAGTSEAPNVVPVALGQEVVHQDADASINDIEQQQQAQVEGLLLAEETDAAELLQKTLEQTTDTAKQTSEEHSYVSLVEFQSDPAAAVSDGQAIHLCTPHVDGTETLQFAPQDETLMQDVESEEGGGGGVVLTSLGDSFADNKLVHIVTITAAEDGTSNTLTFT